MSLTTYDTTGIINSCDYYGDEIDRPNYIKSWTNQPRNTYNRKKRCQKLRMQKALSNPIVRGLETNNFFNYSTLEPKRRQILRFESFDNNKNSIELILFAIIIAFVLLYIKR